MCIKIIFHILTIFRNSMKMNARGVTSTVFVYLISENDKKL